MWLERLSINSTALLDVADARDHLRIIGTESDAEIIRAIEAARSVLDVDADGFGGLGFPLLSQQWRMKLPAFPGCDIRLPLRGVTTIDGIGYVDAQGGAQTLPIVNVHHFQRRRHHYLRAISGATWPQTIDRPDAVWIDFTAGYADVASIPADILAAARLLVTHFFENRNAVVEGVSTELQMGVDRLTSRYRLFGA